MDIVWHTRPIEPYHGKPVVVSEFDAASWRGDILIWVTGEAGELRRYA